MPSPRLPEPARRAFRNASRLITLDTTCRRLVEVFYGEARRLVLRASAYSGHGRPAGSFDPYDTQGKKGGGEHR